MFKSLDMDYAQKMQRCHKYFEALEEERKKIQVFRRELPLCLELVTQAIEACRGELSGTTTAYVHGQSECSGQTMSECGPVFEEFIPIKRNSSCDEDDGHGSYKTENYKSEKCSKNSDSDIDKKKSDWLKSAQLWNLSSDPAPKQDQEPQKATVMEVKRKSGAFLPFHKDKSVSIGERDGKQQPGRAPGKATASAPAPSSFAADTGDGKWESEKKGGEQLQQQTQRKQRRCWSPELHRRFLNALQHLGGSHAATPKQIRELMKFDGLTNDEVKSHLQKYRLHKGRPSPTVHNNSNAQQPQFVVVGGIWVPRPPDSSVIPATTPPPSLADATTGTYTSVAAHSSQTPKRSESGSEERSGRCNSPATSSTTHTNTASPA